MVTPRFLPESGGVETHVLEVARRLPEHGFDVTILTTDNTRTLPPVEYLHGCLVWRARAHPRGRDYRFAPGLLPRIAGRHWGLIHIQSYHTLVAPLAMSAAALHRVPFVLSFHAGGHSSRLRNAVRPVQQMALRPLIARASRLVVLTRFEVTHYGKRLRLPASRFTTIPNGADLPVPAPADWPATDPNLIVSFGRLERYKGHHRMIAAMPIILRTNPHARLWVAGTGPYEIRLRQLVAELDLSNHVHIGGIPPDQRARLARELARARLVVLLSDFETHPIAALEAAALGRRLLVTHTSGLAELADLGIATSIPLSASGPSIAAAVLREMSASAAVSPMPLPSWDQCAAGLAALYREILAP